jgi:UDP-N-acetylmuramate dehydrogenase
MMARPKESASALIAQLPPVRGRLTENAPIGRQTWFGVGGSAEVMFRPADAEDLAAFLALLPAGIPMTVIGVGSNLLVRDGGIAGVTVRLGRGFASIDIKHDEVRVGAGALDRIVAFAAAKAGLAGLEFLSGIPGSIGGSLRMNAGAYGAEVRDVLVSATALDETGRRHTIDCDGMQLSYRHCGVDPCWIFIEARLRGAANDRDVITRQLAEIRASREAAQPVRARTGGSTFANPPGEAAWRLIDAAGCRGLVSEKHANFLINTGNATAADLEGLGEEVRHRVYEARGILLEWEICRIGISVPGIDPIVERYRDLSHTAPRAAPTRLLPGASDGHSSRRLGRISTLRDSIVFRLLQQLQFVDVVKNSVDPRSNEFAS